MMQATNSLSFPCPQTYNACITATPSTSNIKQLSSKHPRMFTQLVPPTKQDINNCSRQHPPVPKRFKNKTLQIKRSQGVQQQMIYGLPTTLTHTTPPYQHMTPLNKIFTSGSPS